VRSETSCDARATRKERSGGECLRIEGPGVDAPGPSGRREADERAGDNDHAYSVHARRPQAATSGHADLPCRRSTEACSRLAQTTVGSLDPVGMSAFFEVPPLEVPSASPSHIGCSPADRHRPRTASSASSRGGLASSERNRAVCASRRTTSGRPNRAQRRGAGPRESARVVAFG